VRASNGPSAVAATDAEGEFLLGGLLPYRETPVTVHDAGHAPVDLGPVLSSLDPTVRVEVRLPDPRWLSVLVLDAETGSPVAGASIEPFEERRGREGRRIDGAAGATAADGTARVGPLPARPHRRPDRRGPRSSWGRRGMVDIMRAYNYIIAA
jgi:hypothetical protein